GLARAQLGELAIDFILCYRAALDVDQIVRIAAKISNHAVSGMNRNPIPIAVWKRRWDDWTDWDIFQFSDSFQNVADLAPFDRELMFVIDVLVGAAAAATEVGTLRFGAVRRSCPNIDNLPLGELFFFPKILR